MVCNINNAVVPDTQPKVFKMYRHPWKIESVARHLTNKARKAIALARRDEAFQKEKSRCICELNASLSLLSCATWFINQGLSQFSFWLFISPLGNP